MKRKLYRLAIIVTFCVSLVVFTPALGISPTDGTGSTYSHAASAKQIPKGRYIIRPLASDTRALTVKGASKKSGANIHLYTCDMNNSQLFDLSYDAEGMALIKNANSKKYMAVTGKKVKKGSNVAQASKSLSKKQRWVLESAGTSNGYPVYRVKSAASNKYYLQLAGGKDTNLSNIRIWTKNKSSAEKFVFVSADITTMSAPAPAIKNGIYKISSALSTSLSLSVPNDSRKNGVCPSLAYNNSDSLSQLFMFTYKDGYYRIRPLANGKTITIKGGNILARTPAVQYTDSKKPHQRFKLVKKSNGNYQIITQAGGLALRVAGDSAAWGKTLETWYSSNAKSQQFKLTPVTNINLSDGIYSLSPYANGGLNLAIKESSTNPGASAGIAADGRDFFQKFSLSKKADGAYSMESVGSGLFITASGSAVVQAKAPSSGASDTQLWYAKLTIGGMKFTCKSGGMAICMSGKSTNYVIKLAKSSTSTKQAFWPERSEMFDNGQYRLDSAAGAGSMEVAGSSFFNLANIQAGAADESGAQAWFVKENADGSITLRNERSGKPIETASSSNGANVRLNKTTGKKVQKWILEDCGDGSFKLRSASANGVYLDAGMSKDAAGKTNMRIALAAKDKAANAQKWRFTPVNVEKPGPEMPKAVADAIEKEARKHLGKPYVFGASGPNSFDCSGFIYYVMNHSGMKEMSRITAQDIYDSCVEIPAASAKRGDLIFFKNTYKVDRTVTHVGIYLGGGKMIEAGSPIKITNVNGKYYKDHFYAYARIA